MFLHEVIIYVAALVITGALWLAWLYYSRNLNLIGRNRSLTETIALNTTMNSLAEVIRNESDLLKALDCVISTVTSLLGADGIIVLQKDDAAIKILTEAYSDHKLRDFLLAHTGDVELNASIANNQEMTIIPSKMDGGDCLNTIVLKQNRSEIGIFTIVHIIGNVFLEHTDFSQYTNKLLYYLNHLTMLALELNKQREIDKLIEQNRESEKRSAELAERLEQELKYKELQNDFISMASHEFRTPLAVIGSSVYLIQRQMKGLYEDWKKVIAQSPQEESENKEVPNHELTSKHEKGYEKVVDLSNNITAYVNHLSSMIGSTLKMAIMDENGIQNTRQAIDLSTQVSSAVNKLQHLRNDVTIDYEDQVKGKWVWFDLGNLEHVLTNLISNAIKYSRPNTKITIKAITAPTGGITLSISDQGIGIPKEQQERLFTKFFRGSNTTGITGVGVGLYVTKKLLILNNADISVESEPDVGTTFIVDFAEAPDPAITEQLGGDNVE